MKTTTIAAMVCVLGAVGCEPGADGLFCEGHETDEPDTTTTTSSDTTSTSESTTSSATTSTTVDACEPAPAFEAPAVDLCFEVDPGCCPGVDADYVASVCEDVFDGALPVPYTCSMQPLPGEATDFRECAALKDVTVACSWGTAVIACCALP